MSALKPTPTAPPSSTTRWTPSARYARWTGSATPAPPSTCSPPSTADARDQNYSWAEIGDLLGITRAAAWNHYGRPSRRGHTRPIYD
jgi:hypothetical protein